MKSEIEWDPSYVYYDDRKNTLRRMDKTTKESIERAFEQFRYLIGKTFKGIDDLDINWKSLHDIFTDFLESTKICCMAVTYFSDQHLSEPESFLEQKRRIIGRQTSVEKVTRRIRTLLLDLDSLRAPSVVKNYVYNYLVNIYYSELIDPSLYRLLLKGGCKINKRSRRFRDSVLLDKGDHIFDLFWNVARSFNENKTNEKVS